MPALPLAILTLPFYVLVPAFYTQALALPIAAVGQVLLVVRMLDGLSATRWSAFSRTGTRTALRAAALWLAASTPLVVVSAWQVFVPPADAGLAHLALWAGALSVCVDAPADPLCAPGARSSRAPMPAATA